MAKKVIIIAGPTAVGKTAVAISLAEELKTEIISADSRQCYKELKIGVARPSEEELAEVPHHFIASHSIHEQVNAASFERYALEKASELFKKVDTIVIVGGTGLYIKAFCEGLDAIPEVPLDIRKQIIEDYEIKGLTWLQACIEEEDPEFYKAGEIQNPQRLMRALEVKRATGISVLVYRKGAKANREFDTIKVALELPREKLYERINTRVDKMMEGGLEKEALALTPYRHLNALQTVGYGEMFDYFDGTISLADAVTRIKTNTRHYAKRQLTWFRKDPEYYWMTPEDLGLPGHLSAVINI